MQSVDLLLNLAGLLLWLGGTARRLATLPASPLSIASLLREAAPPASRRSYYLGALVVLLAGRVFVYWRVGIEVRWVAELDLGLLSLPFNSMMLARMAIYSIASFGVVLFVFYSWLLFLSILLRRSSGANLLQRAVLQHLGSVWHWPAAVKIAGPWLAVAVLWFVSSPALVRMGLTAAPKSSAHLAQQSLLLGSVTVLCWQYLVVGLLGLHILNSYLYLGNHPFWSLVNESAHRLLRPFQSLPLRLGRIDFAPVAAIALAMVLFQLGERTLTELFARLPL